MNTNVPNTNVPNTTIPWKALAFIGPDGERVTYETDRNRHIELAARFSIAHMCGDFCGARMAPYVPTIDFEQVAVSVDFREVHDEEVYRSFAARLCNQAPVTA